LAATNRALVERLLADLWSRGDLGAADELFAPGFVVHNPAFPEQPPAAGGPAMMKQAVASFRAAFPDLRLVLEDLVDGGERVAFRWSGGGTQRAEFAGIPPTGQAIVYSGITIARMEKGKMAEAWVYDNYPLVVQALQDGSS
jgi:steroid delta-isomerase-like uncharacterized protein